MCFDLEIISVRGREILDSRGNPTVEAEVIVRNQLDGREYKGRAAVPSGASTGQFEAVEIRDGGNRYMGLGVQKAVKNINQIINPFLTGQNPADQTKIDHVLKELDGTENKGNLGANAILAVSMACAQTVAKALKISLYRYIGGVGAKIMPIPMMNILNGGAHAKNTLDIQEFMIMPVGAVSFEDALRMGTEVYHHLKKVLQMKGLSTAVGDEGGFAPNISSVEEVLQLLSQAVENAGFQVGRDVGFAMDVAASEWKPAKQSEMMKSEQIITGQYRYQLPKSGMEYTSDELISYYKDLIEKFPILSIEDPLDEEDWDGWQKLTNEIGGKVQLVGDDLFVTNTSRLRKGIQKGCANSILIKPNQIGTLTETIDAIELAHQFGYTAIVSHRSGETEDTTIADLAVALNTGIIKTGAPCRSERTAKYNQLLRIEEELDKSAIYGRKNW